MLPYQGVDRGAEGCSICLFGHPIDSSDLALMCMVNFFCSPGSSRSTVMFLLILVAILQHSWIYYYFFDAAHTLPTSQHTSDSRMSSHPDNYLKSAFRPFLLSII